MKMFLFVTDGDGRNELVVGYTDRVVRAFRWEEPSDASDSGSGQLVLLKKWLLDGQVPPFAFFETSIIFLQMEKLSGLLQRGN